MPRCTDKKVDFRRMCRRVREADFSGGELSSDGGLMLLRQVDSHLGLSHAAALAIPEPRDPERIRPLAVTGTLRSPEFPEVQNFHEQGYALTLVDWNGLFVTAGTPGGDRHAAEPEVQCRHQVRGRPRQAAAVGAAAHRQQRPRCCGASWLTTFRSGARSSS